VSGFDHRAFAEALARFVEADWDGRLAYFVQSLKVGAAFDHWIAVVFHIGRPPTLLDGGGMEEPEPPYDAGPYLLDPFYHRYCAGEYGWCALSEIAPAGFSHSEYMATYYGKLGVGHELGFVWRLRDGDAFHLALTRVRGAASFSRRERDWLRDLSPLIAAVGGRLVPQSAADPQGETLHGALKLALGNFGRSVLTERELQVVHLLLRGHLSKAIARRLGISPGTARNHLKRIYPKLGVASHAELYALFLRALRVAEGEGDPLGRLR
jgi:DNA-binding CsgD family transcriptional regulator